MRYRDTGLNRDTGIQGYGDAEIQGLWDTGLNRNIGIQGYEDADILGYRDTWIQGYTWG